MPLHSQEQKFNLRRRKEFILFVEQNYERLYRYGITISQVEYIVEDAVQESFLILWQKRKEIRQPGAAFFYLMRTLKTKMIRSLREYRTYLPEEAIPLEQMYSISPEDEWIVEEDEREKIEKLNVNLSALPIRQRRIITLHFLEHKSFDEITEIMKIERQSAYNLLSRSLRNLKSKY
ncbi:MAG TPA: sigma-70 family RNA polymerase sigma factor [Membranihabitans sp.]|nr:sigma-70 family RNA polymerase sigma factor [Membranihabitans sp.]